MTSAEFAGRSPFPLRVEQYPDEPAHALLLRTAARNGTSLYSSVFRRSGIKFGRSVQLVDVDLVAHLCRADPAALHRSSARRSPTHVDLLGHTRHRSGRTVWSIQPDLLAAGGNARFHHADAVEGRPGLVAAGDVDVIVTRVTGLWPMAKVKASLGLSLPRVIELADRGWLPYVCRPYARTEPKGKRGDRPALPLRYRPANTWYFEPDAVPAFLQSLTAMVRPDASGAGDLVDLMAATRMFTSTVSVIELVLAGKLPIRGLDTARPGLRGFLVSKSEAGQLLKAVRREGHPLRAAAPWMGMNYNQLRSCVSARLVETTGSGTAISITDEAIAAFKATYVRATELAATFGVKDSRLVIRYLREHGITPLETDAELGMTMYLRAVAGPAAESLPPPVRFASSRERARYQREKGLAVQATRKSYEVSPDWSKRVADRSGRQ